MNITQNRPLMWGIGLLVLGGIITLGTYSAASGGGTYVVTTGLFVVGGINLVRGIYYQLRYLAERDRSPWS
jgi:hypothetical protein